MKYSSIIIPDLLTYPGMGTHESVTTSLLAQDPKSLLVGTT